MVRIEDSSLPQRTRYFVCNSLKTAGRIGGIKQNVKIILHPINAELVPKGVARRHEADHGRRMFN